ncbi:MAG: NAD(P)H-hydrate dehydratase [Lentisphaerae bacterium]|nr:NAD(P)H-hydrate dehydratase [Lentisphaerota bacterium]
MRTLDRRMIEDHKTSGIVLMRRAGMAVAQTLCQLDAACSNQRSATFVAGKGNNGGDAFIAAGLLNENGWSVKVLMTTPPAALTGDAHEAWSEMYASGVEYTVWTTPEEWLPGNTHAAPLSGIVVDGLLGTGGHGAPDGTVAAAINWINNARQRALVVAIDVPSGVDADNGNTPGCAVTADLTVTFVRPKTGFLAHNAQARLGHLIVADIGIDPELIAAAERESDSTTHLVARSLLRQYLPQRNYNSHKGTFGHTCIIGGAPGFNGAPALAALGALRSGAGLVTVAAPAAVGGSIATLAPEAMIAPLTTPCHSITPQALEEWGWQPDKFDAVAIGPGMTATDTTCQTVQWIIDNFDGPIVLDADALNVLPQVTLRQPQRLILTPHPGEAARLLAQPVATIQANRQAAITALTTRYSCNVILKGAGTLLAAPYTTPAIVLGGNPGMATAGSGDILCGIVAAQAARLKDVTAAAALGTWLHSTAGDFASWRLGHESVTAHDIADYLPYAFKLLLSPV